MGRPSFGVAGAVTGAVVVVGDRGTAGLSAAGADATSGRGTTRTATASAKMTALTRWSTRRWPAGAGDDGAPPRRRPGRPPRGRGHGAGAAGRSRLGGAGNGIGWIVTNGSAASKGSRTVRGRSRPGRAAAGVRGGR